jgi:hypothetical protein
MYSVPSQTAIHTVKHFTTKCINFWRPDFAAQIPARGISIGDAQVITIQARLATDGAVAAWTD